MGFKKCLKFLLKAHSTGALYLVTEIKILFFLNFCEAFFKSRKLIKGEQADKFHIIFFPYSLILF